MLNEIYDLYNSATQSAPLITNMATAVATFSIGDVISQYIVDKKINWRKVGFSAILAPFYGAMLYGLVELGNSIGPYVNDNSLAKAALGPNLVGNGANAILFYNNTVGQKNNYSINELTKSYVEMFTEGNVWSRFKVNIPKKEFRNSVVGTLTFWNAFHYFNYEYVSESMRTPAVLLTSVAWLTLLSLWSLKGSRKIVNKK